MNGGLVIFQHGNFPAGWERWVAGGVETYRDQHRTTEFIASLADQMNVSVVASAEKEEEFQLSQSLQALCGPRSALTRERVSGIFDEVKPEYVVCRYSNLDVFRECRKRNIPCLPSLADIFSNSRVRETIYNFRLRHAFLNEIIPCVSNHSLNASKSLATTLRIPKSKIVPWDWSRVPVNETPKSSASEDGSLKVFYAGKLIEEKGVGDCLGALARLMDSGVSVSMTFVGPGNETEWIARAEALGVADRANFLGRISNSEVHQLMRSHDAVIVPSRHAYPEGLPNAIYECLASRTPLIISDHPAFRGRLKPDNQCLVFEAGNVQALAGTLQRLLTDSALYGQLSANSLQGLDGLYIGMEWTRLVTTFLDDPRNRTGWVQTNSLAALTP